MREERGLAAQAQQHALRGGVLRCEGWGSEQSRRRTQFDSANCSEHQRDGNSKQGSGRPTVAGKRTLKLGLYTILPSSILYGV